MDYEHEKESCCFSDYVNACLGKIIENIAEKYYQCVKCGQINHKRLGRRSLPCIQGNWHNLSFSFLFVSLFVLFVYVLVGEEREKNLIIKLVHSHFETTQFKRYGK